MLSHALLTAAVVGFAAAQSVPTTASASDLASVDGQYVNSGFYTPIGNSLAFNIPLKSQALMSVAYGGNVLTNGQALTAAQVAALPTISLTPSSTAAAEFSGSNATFTLMLADAAAIGNPDRQGDYRHFLSTYATATAGANGVYTLNTGNVITQYAGPGPNAGEGPHRYAWLLFLQPANFNAAATQGLNAPGHWQVQQFCQSAGLTNNLVAAAFFTVQNGQASYSVPATSAFVAASSAAQASATASGAASAASSSARPGGSSSASLPTASVKAGSASALVVSVSGLFAAAIALIAVA